MIYLWKLLGKTYLIDFIFTASIAPILLPYGALLDENFAGSQATTSGFGLIDNGNSISIFLHTSGKSRSSFSAAKE